METLTYFYSWMQLIKRNVVTLFTDKYMIPYWAPCHLQVCVDIPLNINNEENVSIYFRLKLNRESHNQGGIMEE